MNNSPQQQATRHARLRVFGTRNLPMGIASYVGGNFSRSRNSNKQFKNDIRET